MDYDSAQSVGAARERYFAAAGFEPGYDDRWVRLRAGPLRLAFPNTRGRVRAVRFHDLHHVATGYDTSWTGEGEIGAWELASGCAQHAWAWFLNFAAFGYGLWLAPRRVFRAFVRGRHTTNLYRCEAEFRDALLDETVAALRARLGLDRPVPQTRLSDALAFAGWVLGAALYGALFTALVAGGVWLAISLVR